MSLNNWLSIIYELFFAKFSNWKLYKCLIVNSFYCMLNSLQFFTILHWKSLWDFGVGRGVSFLSVDVSLLSLASSHLQDSNYMVFSYLHFRKKWNYEYKAPPSALHHDVYQLFYLGMLVCNNFYLYGYSNHRRGVGI